MKTWMVSAVLAAGMAVAVPAAAHEAAAEASRVAAAPSAEPDSAEDALDPARLEAAEQLIAVMIPLERYSELADAYTRPTINAVAAMINNNETLKHSLRSNPRAQAVFDRFLSRVVEQSIAHMVERMPGLAAASVQAYARQFDVPQLEDLLTFMRTPSGRTYSERAPQLMADPAIAAWTRNGMAAQQERLSPLLADFTREMTELAAKTTPDETGQE
ncbi:MAG: DUF2059 domain-containing protein [Sphingopyxis sp.]